MQLTDRTRSAVFAAMVAVLITLVVSLFVTAPVWVWLAAAVAGSGFGVLVAGQVVHRREQAGLRAALERERAALAAAQEPAEPPQPQFTQSPVSGVPLPSAETDYRFLFSGTVCWHQTGRGTGARHANPGDIAVNSVLGRARELTVRERPEDHLLTQYRLGVALGTPATEPQGQVVAWCTDVVVTVPDEDLRRLTRLSELRKSERVYEYERRLEIDMRRYLSEDVFRDTGSAVVWWLARHTDEIDEGVRLIGALAQLTAAANNREVPELPPHYLTAEKLEQPGEHDERTYARLTALSEFLRALPVAEPATVTDLFNNHELAKIDVPENDKPA